MSIDLDCTEIINHPRYPIDELDDPRRETTIEQVKSQLADDGCAVIRDFFSASRSPRPCSRKPANANRQTYYSPRKQCNAYLNEGDPALPQDHPLNIFIPRTNGFITADLFGEESAAHRLYYWGTVNPLPRRLPG